MRFALLPLFVVALAGCAAGTAALPTPDADGVYAHAEEPPELVGGMEGLMRGLTYPAEDRQAGRSGTVHVALVVQPDGTPTDVRCTRQPSTSLCREAVRAVSASAFEPGRVDGEPVPARMTLRVPFRLR